MPNNENDQINIDFRELIKTLIYEVEVLKECLVKNNLITSEDYIKNVDHLRDSKEITFAPKQS